ncbi:hypothetical protein Tco_0718329 [Tanacetum coccineum]
MSLCIRDQMLDLVLGSDSLDVSAPFLNLCDIFPILLYSLYLLTNSYLCWMRRMENIRLLTENPVEHLAAIGVPEGYHNEYVCAVYGNSVQQECYRPLDMAASMDTHADVTDSERSENSMLIPCRSLISLLKL